MGVIRRHHFQLESVPAPIYRVQWTPVNFPNKKTHPLKGRAGNSRGTTLLFRKLGFRLAPDAGEPPLGNPNLGTALRPITRPDAAPYSSSGGPLQDEFRALLSPDFHLPPALWDRAPLLLPFVAVFVKLLHEMYQSTTALSTCRPLHGHSEDASFMIEYQSWSPPCCPA